jgi:hypothetical protein
MWIFTKLNKQADTRKQQVICHSKSREKKAKNKKPQKQMTNIKHTPMATSEKKKITHGRPGSSISIFSRI